MSKLEEENMSTRAWDQVLGEPMGRTWGSIVGFQFGVPVWGSSFGAAKRPPGRVGLFRVSLLESQTGPAFRAKKAPFPESSPSTRSQHFVDMWRGFVSRAVEAGAGIWLHREDSHILWPDGVRASILKRGSQFLLPYERELPPGSTNRVAPVAAGPPDPGPDLGHYEYIPEHDLEAREVEDAAMQAAADQEEG